MIDDKRILAIIPARGGSRSIPFKNLALLGGDPLILHAFRSASNSSYLDDIMLSTDSEQIAVTARKLGIPIPFRRPPELARDDTPMKPVIRNALIEMERIKNAVFDIVALLQPTSPLRTARHIDEAIGIFVEKEADSVVSVIKVPHHFTPNSLMQSGPEGRLTPLEGLDKNLVLRRQDKPALFARNGPAVLILSRDVVIHERPFYTRNTYPYFMSPEDSVDIDTPFDLEIAEFLVRKRQEA